LQQPTRAAEDGSLAARVVASTALAGIGAGSALLRVGNRLLAVHDDAFRVSWISLPDLAMTPWVLRDDGAPLGKGDKPDFESAVRTADGLIHVLGSGCTAKRCVLAQLDVDTAAAALTEHAELYRCVGEALDLPGPPNIEGALVGGDRLRLFHRGVGRGPSASADLAVGVLYGAAPRVLAVAEYDMGAIDGIGLSITDVAAAGEAAIFVGTAEDAADAYADGPVRGSVVGVLDERPRAPVMRFTRLLETDGRPCLAKVEGIAVDGDLRGAWLLTDPDDGAQPARLLRAELRGFG
jgi:uncharacterized protein DUF6929